MTEIKIDDTGEGTWWLYSNKENWKDYVGCENFDEEVVLFGNRDYNDYAAAHWYRNAKCILDGIDYYGEYPKDLSKEINAKLKELYDKCRCTEDIILDVIRLLYPNDIFKTGTIRGCVQREWQNYIIKGDVDTDLLEAFYFGKVADIIVKNENDFYIDVITDGELWKAQREDLREYMRKRYDIDEDEELHIMLADGYKQVVNWKEIC